MTRRRTTGDGWEIIGPGVIVLPWSVIRAIRDLHDTDDAGYRAATPG
jgi:hypothetical protein